MIHTPQLRRVAAHDSYTFLMKELEKVDEKILEPLTGTSWPRDMPVITGGGMVESITVNGHQVYTGGRKFPKDAPVVISFHSLIR